MSAYQKMLKIAEHLRAIQAIYAEAECYSAAERVKSVAECYELVGTDLKEQQTLDDMRSAFPFTPGNLPK